MEYIHVYTHTVKYCLAMRKKTTGMDPEGIILSEISQTKKDKHCMMSLICAIQKKSQSHKYSRKVVTGGWEK